MTTHSNLPNHVYIRFNTDFPGKGLKWRLLDESFNEFTQVTEFISDNCPIVSATDLLPNGQTKHHVKISYQTMIINDDVAEFYR